MQKEIKLFLINYSFTKEAFGEKQEEFHKRCFAKALSNWHAHIIRYYIPVEGGRLEFVEATNEEEKVVLKYFYRKF